MHTSRRKLVRVAGGRTKRRTLNPVCDLVWELAVHPVNTFLVLLVILWSLAKTKISWWAMRRLLKRQEQPVSHLYISVISSTQASLRKMLLLSSFYQLTFKTLYVPYYTRQWLTLVAFWVELVIRTKKRVAGWSKKQNIATKLWWIKWKLQWSDERHNVREKQR